MSKVICYDSRRLPHIGSQVKFFHHFTIRKGTISSGVQLSTLKKLVKINAVQKKQRTNAVQKKQRINAVQKK